MGNGSGGLEFSGYTFVYNINFKINYEKKMGVFTSTLC